MPRAWPIAFVALALSCAAQAPQTAEVNTQDTPAIFTARVNLVLVPVVVRDKNGKVIGTLTKDDFALTDKGKPQTITRFSIEKTGAPVVPAIVATDEITPGQPAPAAEAIPEHFVAYLFDDLHFDIQNVLWARNAAQKHLNEFLEPSVRVAIFTTSGQGSLDFTDDREKIRDALNRLQPHANQGMTTLDCPPMTYYEADAIQNRNDPQAMAAATADAASCSLIMPPPAGATQAQIQAYQQQLQQQVVQPAVSREYSIGFEDSRRALLAIGQVVRRLAAMPGSRSLILVSQGFFLSADHRPDETDIMDRAIRANVTVNSLDSRGLYTLMPDASQPGPISPQSATVSQSFKIGEASANSDVMAEFASATGGKFFENDNGLEQGLKLLASQPEVIYVLGFAPQNLKMDGSYHSLKVTLKNPSGLEVQARRGYYAPKHLADPEEQAKQEIQEAVFSRDEIGDIPVNLNLQFFKSSAASAKVTVVAKIDIRNLRYRKAEGRNDNTLTVISGLFDRNGNFVAGIQKTVEMRLKDETLAGAPASGITVRSVLDVVPGSYMVRLVVRDSEGQTMAARNGAVQIP
jgi:VWFA-related protein